MFSCSVVSDSFATLWTVAIQAPLSMRFPGQEYWSRLPFPSLGDLPHPRIKPKSALQADSLPVSHWRSPSTWGCLLLKILFSVSTQCHLEKNVSHVGNGRAQGCFPEWSCHRRADLTASLPAWSCSWESREPLEWPLMARIEQVACNLDTVFVAGTSLSSYPAFF